MNEALLREIIARILQDPKLQLALAGSFGGNDKPESLVFIDTPISWQVLPDFEKRWSDEFSLSQCHIADLPERPAASDRLVDWEQVMTAGRWSKILVPVCRGQQLAQIATGLETDKLTTLIGWAVRQGIGVEIGRVDFCFTERTPEAYSKMMGNYARQVAAFGVSIGPNQPGPRAEQPVVVQNDPPEIPWSSAAPVKDRQVEQNNDLPVSFDKKLFSGQDAYQLPANSVLHVAKYTVLTPSAIDALKKQKVEVYRGGVKYL